MTPTQSSTGYRPLRPDTYTSWQLLADYAPSGAFSGYASSVIIRLFRERYDIGIRPRRAGHIVHALKGIPALEQGPGPLWYVKPVPSVQEFNCQSVEVWVRREIRFCNGKGPRYDLLKLFGQWAGITLAEATASVSAAVAAELVVARYTGDRLVGLSTPSWANRLDEALTGVAIDTPLPPPPTIGRRQLSLAVMLIANVYRNRHVPGTVNRGDVLHDGHFLSEDEISAAVACLEYIKRLIPGGLEGGLCLSSDTTITESEWETLMSAWGHTG